MKRALLLLAFCAAAAHAEDAPRVAGTIELTDGDVLLEAKDGGARAPANGGDVFEGDTVTTFPKGEIHLQMADGAALIVRENSKITIAKYVADGGDEDRSLIELAKGALRSITGWIGKYNRDNYRIRTPLVTIGVRGTDHEPSHLLEGDPRGEPGSYDKVNEGTAYMKSAEGVIEVPAHRAVFRARARGARPRLLASVPTFFRPGRFERRFETRAREARATIGERRQQRRELIRRRGAGGAHAQRPVQARERQQRPAAKAFGEARPQARPALRQAPHERVQRFGAAKDGREAARSKERPAKRPKR